jgi:hypothetical protein
MKLRPVFCGSKKTLASGVPMARVIFGTHHGLGVIVLPLMFYTPAAALRVLGAGPAFTPGDSRTEPPIFTSWTNVGVAASRGGRCVREIVSLVPCRCLPE